MLILRALFPIPYQKTDFRCWINNAKVFVPFKVVQNLSQIDCRKMTLTFRRRTIKICCTAFSHLKIVYFRPKKNNNKNISLLLTLGSCQLSFTMKDLVQSSWTYKCAILQHTTFTILLQIYIAWKLAHINKLC